MRSSRKSRQTRARHLGNMLMPCRAGGADLLGWSGHNPLARPIVVPRPRIIQRRLYSLADVTRDAFAVPTLIVAQAPIGSGARSVCSLPHDGAGISGVDSESVLAAVVSPIALVAHDLLRTPVSLGDLFLLPYSILL